MCVTDAGQYIVTFVDGQARFVTVEEHRALLARRLVEEVPNLLRETKARLFAA